MANGSSYESCPFHLQLNQYGTTYSSRHQRQRQVSTPRQARYLISHGECNYAEEMISCPGLNQGVIESACNFNSVRMTLQKPVWETTVPWHERTLPLCGSQETCITGTEIYTSMFKGLACFHLPTCVISFDGIIQDFWTGQMSIVHLLVTSYWLFVVLCKASLSLGKALYAN